MFVHNCFTVAFFLPFKLDIRYLRNICLSKFWIFIFSVASLAQNRSWFISSSKRNALKLIDLEPSNEIWNQKLHHIFFRLGWSMGSAPPDTIVAQWGCKPIWSRFKFYMYLKIHEKRAAQWVLTSSFHELPIPNSEFLRFVYPIKLFCWKGQQMKKHSFRIFSSNQNSQKFDFKKTLIPLCLASSMVAAGQIQSNLVSTKSNSGSRQSW